MLCVSVAQISIKEKNQYRGQSHINGWEGKVLENDIHRMHHHTPRFIEITFWATVEQQDAIHTSVVVCCLSEKKKKELLGHLGEARSLFISGCVWPGLGLSPKNTPSALSLSPFLRPKSKATPCISHPGLFVSPVYLPLTVFFFGIELFASMHPHPQKKKRTSSEYRAMLVTIQQHTPRLIYE